MWALLVCSIGLSHSLGSNKERPFLNYTTMKKTFLLLMLLCASLIQAQDVIFTLDGNRINAKILEVSKSEIKYKLELYLGGPTFTITTDDIKSVLYGNGMEIIYNASSVNSVEPESETTKVPSSQYSFLSKTGNTNYQDTFDLTSADAFTRERNAPELSKRNPYNLKPIPGFIMEDLYKYLDRWPKHILAIRGNYKVIFDKRSTLYIDYDMSHALQVEYDRNESHFVIKNPYNENPDIDKQQIVRNVCTTFREKLFTLSNNKCKMLPLDDLKNMSFVDSANTYIVKLYIEGVDLGDDGLGYVSINSSAAGGVVITGKMDIYNTNGSLLSTLIVDRVKGLTDPILYRRFQNTMIEIWCNRLYRVREFEPEGWYYRDIDL